MLTLKHSSKRKRNQASKRKRNQEGITPLKKKCHQVETQNIRINESKFINLTTSCLRKGRNTPINQYSIVEEKDYINICVKQNKQLHDTEEKSF